ncbi:MAG TPA: hypothetical protein VKG24_28545, partial [Pseudolabrys sp.]|nr:hypothetical protein [Pseudolabrys sp.]
ELCINDEYRAQNGRDIHEHGIWFHLESKNHILSAFRSLSGQNWRVRGDPQPTHTVGDST